MRGTVLDCRGQVLRGDRPAAARRWSTSTASGVAALRPLVDGITYAGRPPTSRGCQPGWAWRSTAARQPARPTKQTAAGRSHAHSRSSRAEAGAVLVAGELGGSGRGSLHEVGHPDAVVAEGVASVAVARGEPGLEGGRPEAVAGRDVADAGVGGVHARVEAAHQQLASRRRRSRAGCGARRARIVKVGSPVAASVVSSSTAKPAPCEHVAQPLLGPRREPAAREGRRRGTPRSPPPRRRTPSPRSARPARATRWRSSNAIGTSS